MWGALLRGVAAIAISIGLLGCAEFNHRGGILDQVSDQILFRADSKSHRLLRAYLVAGALVTVARQSGLPAPDQAALAGRMNDINLTVYDAFVCAYQSSNGCAFFDEKMARIDYNIYKLAVLVVLDPESREQLADARDRLVGQFPIVGSALRSITRANQAIGDAATATQEASAVVDGLLRLSYTTGRTTARLAPLYRDAIEMDMIVVVDSFARRCALYGLPKTTPSAAALDRTALYNKYFDASSGPALVPSNPNCMAFVSGYETYAEGYGDLRAWRQYLASVAGTNFVTPSAEHFIAVSRLVYDSCDAVVANQRLLDICAGENREGKSTTKAAKDTKVFALLFYDEMLKQSPSADRAVLVAKGLSRPPTP